MQEHDKGKHRLMNSRKRISLVVALIVVLIGVVIVIARADTKTNNASNNGKKQTVAIPEPSITFKDLTANQTVSGTVDITLTIDNASSLARVEYYIDGKFVGVTYASPFTFKLDTTTLTNGSHTIEARGFDTNGKKATTQSVTITVANGDLSVTTPPAASSTTKKATTASSSSSSSSSSDSGGSTPTPPDTTAPTVPTNVMLSASDGYTANVSWTASTDSVGVAGYKIYRDSTLLGTSATTSYQDQTVVPGNTYHYAVAAYDAAGNVSAQSSNPSITMATTSVWIAGDTPQNFASAGSGTELGVKFRPLVNGQVTGVRFYKGSANTGTHIGHLWSSSGTSLASATFSGESPTGWQDVTFASPVSVTAGTTYVASYWAPNDGYGYTSAYFATAGITSQYLTAMASGVDGNNGVFAVTNSFPSSSFDNTNYWVDVDFAPNANAAGPSVKLADNSQVYSGYPGSNNSGLPAGKRLPHRDREVDVYADNAIVENIEVREAIKLFGDNVTIRNSRVTTTGLSGGLSAGIQQTASATGTTVQNTDIYGDGGNQMQYGIKDDSLGMTITGVNIWAFSNGIQANEDETITDSFVHDPVFFSGDHTDSFISTGGNNVTLNHNTFLNQLAQTSAIGLFCDFSPITNFTVNNNLLGGGGYALYAGGSGSGCSGSNHIVITNNRFTKKYYPNSGFFGTDTNYNAGQTGNTWTGNVWYEDGTVVNP